MFGFEYSDSDLKDQLEDPEKYLPEEVSQEIPGFLDALRKDGQVRDPDYFRGNINKIAGNTFELQYISDLSRKTVRVLDLKIKSLELLRSRFSIADTWDDKDVIDIIPQCDSPKKLIKALKLIFNGVVDSYELGYELGHRGKQRKDIRRHGQYTRQALESLKLITSYKVGNKLLPELTERGKRIAETSDQELQNKLLTVAMLNYAPVWKIVSAITDQGKEEFDELTIQRIAFPEELREATTCSRRTKTLKAWIRWISKTSGIPIRLPGGVTQLSLFNTKPSDFKE